jgi:phosphate transport system substrate-binding protein
MKKRSLYLFPLMAAIGFIVLCPSRHFTAMAADEVHIDGSAQMYEAFIDEGTKSFVKDTGVKAVAEQHTSTAGIRSLADGKCTIAAVARKLKPMEKDSIPGVSETLVAKDALAVYVNKGNSVSNLTLAQVQDIFAGKIKNWQEVGGPQLPIQVVIPSVKTTCCVNFQEMVMGKRQFADNCQVGNIASDTLKMVVNTPGAVSFISCGALADQPKYKMLNVNSLKPGESGYHITQEFYLDTKGQPAGDAKRYIDYFISGKGRDLIKSNKMFPPK